MLPRNHPDRIHIAFDDPRLVANAGLLLPATLALRLGLSALVDRHLNLGDAPGRANTGDKLMTLVASALAGGDCIDDAGSHRMLRAGSHPPRPLRPRGSRGHARVHLQGAAMLYSSGAGLRTALWPRGGIGPFP